MDALTRDEKTAIVLQIFDDFKYMGGLRLLTRAAPNKPESEIVEFVEAAFNELITWIEND